MNPLYLVFKALILPPTSLVLLGALGFCLWQRRPALARWLIGISLLSIYLLSTKIVADALTAQVLHPVVDPAGLRAAMHAEETGKRPGAIVVIAGGLDEFAPEYSGNTVNEFTLVRLRYAAHLHHRTGLPILVSGGGARENSQPEGALMARTLRESFHVAPAWVEQTSKTTWQNAQFSYDILRADGISRIVLVTHALHMPRSVRAFEKAGFDVIAAPTGYYSPPHWTWDALVPRSQYLHQSHYAFYEIFGAVLYAFKG